ncbi:hypothetical protein DFJ58DRAFT_848318 [Suillus subalutaceus]|uniref:uncharacterized protein n=1 Tax=Suillus subalutaceus TaxID=48586 RepID=UPI001B86111D|nr:uncharacterized protein DFJ58DRAFT_737746 [Suillus subalutaceus]XP_041235482.1 uncharacterized protein DFJ58DRAFT_848318 [Suillus subalutaceus]KAG1828584.1 hypothetical protein DFJ58DRAFT_737746 [Suillus subalutaceus]KAG1830984.1 hypothetical protein DFJ58DRAFT_848318 [Suillus subalutaceus]
MVQLEQTGKKPRLQHSDLANSALTPEEKQRERQKRWVANEKRDPHRAQEMKEQNTANKRAWRKRKREEMQSKQLTPNTNSQSHAPQKRPRTSSPEAPSGHVGPSISEPDTIPIGPILLAQETLTTIVTPRPMRDIAVMTDTPSPPVNCSSIPDDQAYPSPTLSALTDLEFRDLANPIIGSQVHEQSDTVQWDDGSTTVLPCIMKNGINICEEDALAVSFFASLPESLPATSKNVVHLQHSDRRFTSRQLCDEISAALRINKAVVIRQVSTPEPATLDLEYLEDRGMSDLMRVVVHDAEQRTKDFTYPHQNATLAEFIRNIHDPNKIQCILDVPYGQGGLPSYLSTLDSGITNGWNQTTVDCPIGDKVHPDNFIVHSWSLLHGPAYWTNPHHDSDGSVTFVQIETGEKKWGLFKPIHEDTITRTNLSNIALTLTDLYRNRENIQENWHGEIVTLLPGDMLIQPAGQFHAVYTPVASFATGGHFYNYECMHLTELSRYIDHKQGKILTNQVHAHSLETFQRMVINLPRISRRVKLYNRPLIALCTMVLECDKYVAAGTEKPKVRSSTTQPAHDIANAIIKHFWKDLKTATKTYRKKQTDGSNNQMHPGEPISREELLTCLKRFTTL